MRWSPESPLKFPWRSRTLGPLGDLQGKSPGRCFSRRDRIMIYVTLPSNSSINIYTDNKILSFKANLRETLQVDPEHWEVALKEIQFPHLWYNVRKDKFIVMVGTILL